ncbi:hypothetical protein [Tomitella cavernea]|uniref:Uncharacterized protein n=1 Tax=Tomitella cavernea TaxID=1387982 RepID=A0ABP9CFL5_9ACTN|nr:hypothetical protein [Tomitella cavernea]
MTAPAAAAAGLVVAGVVAAATTGAVAAFLAADFVYGAAATVFGLRRLPTRPARPTPRPYPPRSFR